MNNMFDLYKIKIWKRWKQKLLCEKCVHYVLTKKCPSKHYSINDCEVSPFSRAFHVARPPFTA